MSIEYAWYDLVGNVGVMLVLLAYLLLQTGHMHARTIRYNLVNGAGALLIMVSLCYTFNLSSFIIEIAWLLISLYGLIMALLRPLPDR